MQWAEGCASQHAMRQGDVYPSMQWAMGCVSQHAIGWKVYPRGCLSGGVSVQGGVCSRGCGKLSDCDTGNFDGLDSDLTVVVTLVNGSKEVLSKLSATLEPGAPISTQSGPRIESQ